MPERERNRKDHILPQGYLDGFTGPNGRLQVWDIEGKRWFQSTTEDVACERGYYDYSEGVVPDQTADQALREYEDDFPKLRRELLATNFTMWRRNLPFLLRYINSIRVRSRLFRQHVLQSFEQQPPMVVGEIHENVPHTKIDGELANARSLKPMEQTGERLQIAYNDLSISKMRADILEVPKFFFEYSWSLRYTTNPNNPVITADDAIHLEFPFDQPNQALRHFQSRLHFPLCWQACLIGSPHQQLPNTKVFSPARLSELRRKYLRSLCRFAYSPIRLNY